METRYHHAKGVELRVTRSETGDLYRLDLEIEGRPGNLAITWNATDGATCYVEGKLRNEDLGGSHPLARVAELVPVRVPPDVIRGAVTTLRLDGALEHMVLDLLIGNLDSKSAR